MYMHFYKCILCLSTIFIFLAFKNCMIKEYKKLIEEKRLFKEKFKIYTFYAYNQ
jgi:hypothetical protein